MSYAVNEYWRYYSRRFKEYRKQLVLNRASAGNIAHWVITFDPSLVLCQILERTFIWTPMQLHVEKILCVRHSIIIAQIGHETGRWSCIPKEDRLCPCDVIQTEQHVICHCPLSDHIRAQFVLCHFVILLIFWYCLRWCSLSCVSFDSDDLWLKLSFSCINLMFTWCLLPCEIVIL